MPRLQVRSCSCIGALLFLFIMLCPGLYASEGGQSSYPPGFQDRLAGFLPPPGSYFQEDSYFYSGNASAVVREGRVLANLHMYLPVQFSIFNPVTKNKLWGSYYSWAILVPWAEPQLSGSVVTPIGDRSFSQSVSGLSETEIVPIMLGWHNGRSHQKTWLTIYAPTGKYNTGSFVNTTLNRWAVELDYAYTYWNMKTGFEFDAAPGYTFNTENPDTNYLSGQEFHTDLAAIQHLSPKLGIGAVGYVFVQTTPDSGSGAYLGSFEGRTYALGPIATYNTKIGSVPVGFTGKYYGEFDVSKRFEGHSYWLNVNAAF